MLDSQSAPHFQFGVLPDAEDSLLVTSRSFYPTLMLLRFDMNNFLLADIFRLVWTEAA